MTATPRIEPLTFPRAQSLALSVVVACADGGRGLLATLDALREARLAVPYEVLAVVGGEAAPGLAEVRRAQPLVLMYRAPEATDLGALYDLGARAAAGRHLLLLDGAMVPDAAAVAELVRFAETGQWIAAVVPRYVGADGAERPASRTFPTLASAFAEGLGRRARAEAPAPRLQYALNRKVTTPKEVEAAEGGCVLVRRQAVLDVGGFAGGYAAGGELLDWCMRARQRGWAIFFHPGVEARGGRVEADADRRAIAHRFVRRFYGPLPAALVWLAAAPGQAFGQGMKRAALPAGTTAWTASSRTLRPSSGLSAGLS